MAGPGGSRWERVDRIAVAIFGVLVAAGLVARQAGAPTAVLIVLAALGLAGAILHAVLVGGKEQAQTHEAKQALLSEPPIRVATLRREQLYVLGVDAEAPAALKRLGIHETSAAYEPRDLDRSLRDGIEAALARLGVELIVITGHSKAGKSRSALEAVAAAGKNAWLLRPAAVREQPAALADLAAARPPVDGPVVIWLDDLEDWARPDGLTPKILDQLQTWKLPVVVLSTAYGKGARRVARDDFQDDVRTLVGIATDYPLRNRPTDSEYAQLRKRFGETIARRLKDEGIGEFLIAADDLVERLDYHGTPVARALVRAAIDCRRTGYLDPIPIDWLRTLHSNYHNTFGTDSDIDGGLRWATERLYANTGLLDCFALPNGQHAYDPYDYLVDYVTSTNEPIPAGVWDHVTQHATRWLARIGVAAIQEGGPECGDRAEHAFHRGGHLGEAQAIYNLGVLLYKRDDLEGAEAAYRRADERGHRTAAHNLAFLLHQRGDLDGAEAAYRRADERGSDDALCNLGALLKERGDIEGAEATWRRADEYLHAPATHNLGVLLQERGDLEGAEAAYRRADERGHGPAAYNLGLLHYERGDLEGARAAWRRADERGSSNAAHNLGVLLQERGDLEGAEAAYRRADERGHGPAAYNLGGLLAKCGDLEGAEAAYRRADHRGHKTAAYDLAGLLLKRAQGWSRISPTTGPPDLPSPP